MTAKLNGSDAARRLTVGTVDLMCREAPRCGSCVRANQVRSPSFHQAKPLMPFHVSSPYLLPILLLICSNLFMTFAWYGHLRFKEVPLLGVILVSWGIAFVEYCFAVPANRYGNAVYSAAQLKTMQEVITLVVFSIFSFPYLKG